MVSYEGLGRHRLYNTRYAFIMKIALAHDYLNQLGGGERVFEVLLDMFQEAEVYTLLYDEAATRGRFKHRVIHTSFLDNPYINRHHRGVIPLMPLAAWTLRIPDDVDLVISDSASFAKAIRVGKNTKHLSYIHTPLRYAWETRSYFKSKLFMSVFAPLFAYMRRSDYRAAQRPEKLLANSRFIAEKIQHYYQRSAEVLYPPYDSSSFYFDDQVKTEDYFLAVGRLLSYKRFDLIIAASKELGLPLKIVGEGREYTRLLAQAKGVKNIEFLGFVAEEKLRDLYANARALIFPHVEDFGLVAVEAQACGTPVIALNAGGAREIVINERTGVLFEEQSVTGLKAAIKRCMELTFDREEIAQSAKRFSREQFEAGIWRGIKEVGK